VAWTNAVKLSEQQLEQNPADIYARFNLSVAYHNIGDYQKSVEEFEKIQNQLPFRTLWYQIEPIDSYFKLGNYNKVFQISDSILNNQNRAYSELYLLRGNSYLKQGDREAAQGEFEKALLYNKNLKSAQEALISI
jgi:tetratricopeptide (TPR) repeat protein